MSDVREFRPGKDPDLERVASECDLYGHDYEVQEDVLEAVRRQPRMPWKVFCSRCGKSWKVER